MQVTEFPLLSLKLGETSAKSAMPCAICAASIPMHTGARLTKNAVFKQLRRWLAWLRRHRPRSGGAGFGPDRGIGDSRRSESLWW